MIHTDDKEPRKSQVTERKFSTSANDISQGFQAAMGMLVTKDNDAHSESPNKRRRYFI